MSHSSFEGLVLPPSCIMLFITPLNTFNITFAPCKY